MIKKYLIPCFYNIGRHIQIIAQLKARLLLTRTKKYQKIKFNTLKMRFEKVYLELKRYSMKDYVTPLWKKFNSKIESALLPFPRFSFLMNSTIRFTMFFTMGKTIYNYQLSYLKKTFSKKKLNNILQEDPVGNPTPLYSEYLTSHNSVHHLFHLLKFINKTSCNFDKINTVVEWGGGYGNMAKITQRLTNKKLTYIIIDTPIFSCLQWLYLSTIFGENCVKLLQKPEDTILSKKINILPLCFLDKHDISADVFISTWGLSESTKFSQDYVFSHNWFNANLLLLAYQKNDEQLPQAERIGKYAFRSGALLTEISFLPGNYYAFR